MVSVGWGWARSPAGVAIAHWGLAWLSRRERERGPGRVWSRAPLPPFDPTRYDKGRSLARFCAGL
jgi:hypothetical protein